MSVMNVKSTNQKNVSIKVSIFLVHKVDSYNCRLPTTKRMGLVNRLLSTKSERNLPHSLVHTVHCKSSVAWRLCGSGASDLDSRFWNFQFGSLLEIYRQKYTFWFFLFHHWVNGIDSSVSVHLCLLTFFSDATLTDKGQLCATCSPFMFIFLFIFIFDFIFDFFWCSTQCTQCKVYMLAMLQKVCTEEIACELFVLRRRILLAAWQGGPSEPLI